MARGRIIAVGSREEVNATIGSNNNEVRRLDLQGKAVIPGLIDAHIHCLGYSRSLRRVNLDGVTSKEEALRLVAEKVAQARPGEWVVGGGWNNNLWSPPDFPTRQDLDRIAPQNPVFLNRKDLHSCWVNSVALERAGVTKETPDPPGAKIGRDESGEPDGIFYENAVALVSRVSRAPASTPARRCETESRCWLRWASWASTTARVGIREADSEGPELFAALRELENAGELQARVVSLIPCYELENAIQMWMRTGFGWERLRIGPVKIFSDGSLGSMTAEMLEPYEGQANNRGIRTISQEDLEEMILSAARRECPPPYTR